MRIVGVFGSLALVSGVFGCASIGCGGAMSAKSGAPAAEPSVGYPTAPAAYAASDSTSPSTSTSTSAPVETGAGSAAVAASAAPIAKADVGPVARGRQGGLLTAGVWDDARNFDFFLGYAHKLENRGSDFDLFAPSELAHARDLARAPHAKKRALDVALVFDTTGSMGDELSYVQTEFEAIARSLHDKLPEVEPRWSLVVYKDHGDEYVTRTFDFTTDTAKFRRTLDAQSAGGGGDYPEAVVEAMQVTNALEWRNASDVAKVAFWVADAPTHDNQGGRFASEVRALAQKNVHLYPIAASGADDLTEYEMRSAAFVTGGKYLFLTDDSGVGGAHAEPHIPCYAVTKLDRAIVRMLEIEVRGEHVPVAKGEALRTVGQPRADETCVLPSGELVAAY